MLGGKLIYTAIFLTLIGYNVAFCQVDDLSFDHLSVNDGLSQSVINCLCEDSDGFMWIGTQDGLNRYDGYEFTIYKHNPFDSSSISDNYIWTIFEDSKGFLWVGTYGGGLNKFNRRTKSFIHYKHNQSDSLSISSDVVRGIYEDEKGFLWIATFKGLNILDPASGKFFKCLNDEENPCPLPHNVLRTIFKDSRGNIWIAGYGDGLIFFNKNTKSFQFFANEADNLNSLSCDKVWTIIEDKFGSLWIPTFGGGLNKLDYEVDEISGEITLNFERFRFSETDKTSLPEDKVTAIFEDADGSIWAGCDGKGLALFNRENNNFMTFTHEAVNQKSLSNNSVYSIVQDENKILWIGTFGGGINLLDKRKSRFKHISDKSRLTPLNSPIVSAVNENENGELWIGTYGGGVNIFNRKNGKIFYLNDQPGAPFADKIKYINTIAFDKSGKAWFGTDGEGAFIFNPQTNDYVQFKKIEDDNKSLPNDFVKKIFQDSKGNIWLATLNGLALFNPSENNFKNFYHDPNDSNSLSHRNIRAIYEDRRGRLWFGAYGGGLNLYDYQTGTFRRILQGEKGENSLSGNQIRSIVEDSEGYLWIGTNSAGLNRFNPEDNSVKIWTEKEGLSNNTILGIEKDEYGFLWIITNKGISRFDPEKEAFQNFFETDGLMSDEFAQGAILKSRDGKLYFGNIEGLEIIDPAEFEIDSFIAPLRITQIKLLNEELSCDRIDREKNLLTVSHFENFITIKFASLDYSNSKKIKYRYKVEGLFDEWIDNGYNRIVNLTNLPTGDYRFRVEATNGAGEWNTNEAGLNIDVLPPFWFSWQFILLNVVLILGAISAFVFYRLRQVLAYRSLRRKISADLHDDIGAGLTEISFLGEILKIKINGNSGNQSIPELSKIGDISRRLIDDMSDIVWVINPKQDSFSYMISRLGDNFNDILESKNVELQVSGVDEIGDVKLKMNCRQNVYMILREALNNSLKYSGCKKINLSLSKHKKIIEIKYSDDGCGFDADSNFPGNGLKNMKFRAEQIGAQIEIVSSSGAGMEILLSVKIK